MLAWKGGEFEPDLSLVIALYTREFFRFLQVCRISKIEFRLCLLIPLSKGSLKDV